MRVRASRPCGCEAGGAVPRALAGPAHRAGPGRSRAQQGRGHDGDGVLIAVGVTAGGDHDGVGEALAQALAQPQQVAGVPRARRGEVPEHLRAETVLRTLGALGEGRPDLLADLTFRGAALTIVGIERSLSSAPDAHFRRRPWEGLTLLR